MSSSDYTARLKYCKPEPPCCVNVFPTVNVDICGTQFDISHADVHADSALVDICSATVNAATVNLDISSATIDVFNGSINTATLNLDISSVTIDISNATLQVDTVTMDVSSATINSAVTNLDISNATVDICSGTVAISNVTLSGDLGILANGDAFGRLRVSNPYTLFEFSSILGKQPDIIDEDVSGSGFTTAMIGDSYIKMGVSGAGYAIRQSHEYIIYQPGKSKLVYMTGVLQDPNGANMSGNTARIGCFDASMGFYVESSGGIVSVVKHNSTYEQAWRHASEAPLGAPVWLDPLDGTGPSGVDVSFNRAQIFVFDFEWLGVGQVRCGIVIGGQLIYFYKFTHANVLIMPYITMAKLPLRYEIRGSIGAAPNQMHMICGTVISEGGFTPLTRTLHYANTTNTNAISVSKSTSTILKPLIALRLRPEFPYNRTTIKLKAVDIFNTTGSNSYGSWVVLLNPPLTFKTGGGFSNYNVNTSSAMICDASMNDLSGTDLSGISIIYSGFYSTRDTATFSTTADELVASKAITTGLNGTSDVIVLCANNFSTGDAQLYFYFTWIEYI